MARTTRTTPNGLHTKTMATYRDQLAAQARKPAHVMIVAHPMLGALLTFTDYDQGYAVSDDIGQDYDLTAFGFLKSRGHIVHTDDSFPACRD